MPELSAAPSINDTRTQALLVLISRLAALDLTTLLVYRIDSVVDGALPFLAWQFDILSPLWQLIAPVALGVDALTNIDLLIDVDNLIESGGLVTELALTEAAQRELLKNAIALHRFRGTPWSVKQALASLGWTTVSLLEGQTSWGGVAYPSNQGWAVFRVMIDLAAGQGVSIGAASTAVAAVNFFKPARAWLDSVWFAVPAIPDPGPVPSDRLTLGGIAEYQLDSATAPSDNTLAFAIALGSSIDARGPIVPAYDGHYRHSGITYGANQPEVADSALIVNGAAVLHGG
ncbi:MAG: phage tail protein [Candidatus Binatus sp.]|uniref:phage tail protein n=1 Tax=Candidatus Binatus sp. TaxID=2811406 RepID=UPI003BB03C4B